MSEVEAKKYDRIYGVFGVRKKPGSAKGDYFRGVDQVEDVLVGLNEWHQGNIKLVSGGSHGVEMIAEEWALKNEIDFERVKPILHDGHIAPFDVRNEKIIDRCTDLLVWWDAEDTQIGRTLRIAVHRGKSVQIFPVIYEE